MAFSDGLADFRSDTVTRPTAAMRAAMAAADVGDDVYGEDPTVNALEERVAEILGVEASLFVTSGTMGNQIAISLLTSPGDEIMCVETAHVRNYENGAASSNSGVAFRTVPTDGGQISTREIVRLTTESGYHLPAITVLSWENTHNYSGGTVVPFDVFASGSETARSQGMQVHLDGARLWNAAVASDVNLATWAAVADSVQVCFSKGLGAPVGSAICGTKEFVKAARAVRHRLGGAMRQVGVLAAAVDVALDDWERVEYDHVLARELAAGLAARFSTSVDPDPETNMVLLHAAGCPVPLETAQTALADAGIRVGFMSPTMLRFCTHRDVDSADVGRVLAVMDMLVADLPTNP
jgi:threonine aldolase